MGAELITVRCRMSHPGQISGWLFVALDKQTVMFMAPASGLDGTGLPWELLKEERKLEKFRRDFSFKETELTSFIRFKIEIEENTLRKWFEENG